MSRRDEVRDRFGDKYRPLKPVSEHEKRRAGAFLAKWLRDKLGRPRPPPEQKPDDDEELMDDLPF